MTKHFHDIEFQPGRSDPDKAWCLSVKQPLASLLVEGGAHALVKTGPPPKQLLRKDIVIHAGGDDFTLKSFSDAARAKTEAYFERPLSELRARAGASGLPHGALIGEARLVAAFVCGQTVDGRTHANLSARYTGGPYSGGFNLGAWSEFEGEYGVLGEPYPGRFIWCFLPVLKYPEARPFKGFGGIFDLAAARRIRAARPVWGDTSHTRERRA